MKLLHVELGRGGTGLVFADWVLWPEMIICAANHDIKLVFRMQWIWNLGEMRGIATLVKYKPLWSNLIVFNQLFNLIRSHRISPLKPPVSPATASLPSPPMELAQKSLMQALQPSRL